MKKIQLTQGKYATVDNTMFALVAMKKWYAWFNPSTKSFYAVRTEVENGKKRTVYMHRLITRPSGRLVVDHKNGNTLDNRGSNLRLCTQRENVRAGKGKKGASVHKGVIWNKQRKKWQARIFDGDKSIHLGLFEDEKDAATAYNGAAKKLFSKFAYKNQI